MFAGMPAAGSPFGADGKISGIAPGCSSGWPSAAGSPNIGSTFVTPTVAGSIDLVVHLRLDRDGQRRVEEIAAIPGGLEAGVVELENVFHTDHDGALVRGPGFTHLGDRFAAVGKDIHSILEAA